MAIVIVTCMHTMLEEISLVASSGYLCCTLVTIKTTTNWRYFLVYRRRSNYASFLILCQNAFKLVISNDMSLTRNSFLIVVSHGLAGSKSRRSSLPVTFDV